MGDGGLDTMTTAVNDALRAGHPGPWPDLEAWTAALDLDAMDTTAIVAVLSAVSHAQGAPWLPSFTERCASVVRAREPDRAPRILRGLVDA